MLETDISTVSDLVEYIKERVSFNTPIKSLKLSLITDKAYIILRDDGSAEINGGMYDRVTHLKHKIRGQSEKIEEGVNTSELLHKRLEERGLSYQTQLRWHELFGTPERAARTLANVCQFTHGGELCDRCQAYLFNSCDRTLRLGSEQKIYDALLEWLRGDA